MVEGWGHEDEQNKETVTLLLARATAGAAIGGGVMGVDDFFPETALQLFGT
jgi:hypothetical protein